MWVKSFQAGGDFYLYSAYRNTIHCVPRQIFAVFEKENGGHEQRQLAIDLGLMPDAALDLDIFPASMIREGLERLRREGPARLVLSVTEGCNFRCRYCVFSGAYRYARRHGSRNMPLETAFRAVRWYFGFAAPVYRIAFYGGEPLLELDLIRKTVDMACREVSGGARLSLSLTTNGSLLDDAAIEFLAAHSFHLFISLDGPARIHDRYRRSEAGRPSFARIWERIQRIRQLVPEFFEARVNFCMTLAPPDPVPEIMEFVEENREIFANKIPVLAGLEDASPALYESLGVAEGESAPDLDPLRERYLGQLASGGPPDGIIRAANDSAMAKLARRSMTAAPDAKISAGQCVPGRRCHVTPDGKLHPCERANHQVSIGDVATGFDYPGIESLLRRFGAIAESHCGDCWAVRLCSRCIIDVAGGSSLSSERLSGTCAHRKRDLEKDLMLYCRARSKNSACFRYLTETRDGMEG